MCAERDAEGWAHERELAWLLALAREREGLERRHELSAAAPEGEVGCCGERCLVVADAAPRERNCLEGAYEADLAAADAGRGVVHAVGIERRSAPADDQEGWSSGSVARVVEDVVGVSEQARAQARALERCSEAVEAAS